MHPGNQQAIVLASKVLDFTRAVRAEGYNIGIQESLEAQKLCKLGVFADREKFKYGLAAIFCHSFRERQQFNTIFDQYWQPSYKETKSKKHVHAEKYTTVNQRKSIVMLGYGKTTDKEDTGDRVFGANAAERLRKTDFSQLSELEYHELEKLAESLFRQLNKKWSRRYQQKGLKGMLNYQKTIRKSLEKGGIPFQLEYRSRQITKPKIAVLLDVSGSMDKYSFYLLKFLFALQKYFDRMEAFIFSTQLVRITDLIKRNGVYRNLKALSKRGETWSGGTRIGACFTDFIDGYGKIVLDRKTTVIVLSDGLDTGPPEHLVIALKKIKQRSGKLVWLNPLKGTPGYEPTARGMKSAKPYIDHFGSAHNLKSLLELESILANA
jgi:uncharacterized protein with von Willebrand factor type A (vWA) domain